MKPPVTIRDVARRANVSPKTVSRVINGEQHVRAALRDHVMAVVEELEYRPNAFARGLSSSRSFLVGLFFDDPVSSYAADIQRGAMDRCRGYSHHLVIEAIEREQPDWLARLDGTLRELRLAGAVLTPPICDWTEALDLFERHDIPVVRLAPAHDPARTPQVRIDDRAAARLMTERLIALGHRDIAFIGGDPAHSAAIERRRGFLDAVGAAGINVPFRRLSQGDFSFKSGLSAAESILADADRPSAIFAANDEMALAVLAVAMRHGVAVPDGLSVVGFDDAPIARMASPQLTTMRQPNSGMGAAAIDLLLGPSRHAPEGNDGACVELPFELVERTSTAPKP